jgi:hypothetical protein
MRAVGTLVGLGGRWLLKVESVEAPLEPRTLYGVESRLTGSNRRPLRSQNVDWK